MATAVGVAITTIAAVLCLGALKAATRGVEELPEGILDERQAQIRGRVYAISYTIGANLLSAGLAIVAVWLFLDLLHLALLLPSLVAAVRHDV